MISIDDLPERAIDAARLAMARALAADGDGIPECIVAALNTWEGMHDRVESYVRAQRLRAIAEHALAQWKAWIDAVMTGTSFHGHALAEVERYRLQLRDPK